MKRTIVLGMLAGLFLVGCSDKEKEQALEQQLNQTSADRASMQQLLAERDSYLDQVISDVNDIYADLEQARTKEGRLVHRAEGVEGQPVNVTLDTRKQLLVNISEIDSTLKDNRKRIGDLQARVKAFTGDIANLNKLVENLKLSILEREQSIAQLEARVQGLETTVMQKTMQIQEKEMMLDQQQKKMNTVYYVAGTKEELEKKGIITNEGGFLWGLLGSTTIMSSGVDQSVFTALDKTKDQMLHVPGTIDEILPRRSADYFAASSVEENSSDLKILRPEKFWQDNYLVVVLD